MNGGAQRPDTASTRRKLTLPRWLLLLLVMSVWPLLAFLFHGLLPCVLSGMVWVGWAVFYGSWVLLVATFLLWLVLNHIVIPREERGLEERHKKVHSQHLREVRRWF